MKGLIKKISKGKISAVPVQQQLTTKIQEKDWQQSRVRVMVYHGSGTEEVTNSHNY